MKSSCSNTRRQPRTRGGRQGRRRRATPLASAPMGAATTIYRAADEAAVRQLFEARGWTDGLPIVPPTPERVAAMLEWGAFTADQLLGVEPVKSRPLVAEKVAVNAVLAGCEPRDFPVVAAAVQALCDPALLVHGATASTGGCAILLIVNGPV